MQTERIVSHHNLVVDNHRTSMGEDTRNVRLMVALNGVGTAYFDPRPAVVKFLEKTRRSGAPDWDIYGQREFVRKFTRETGLFSKIETTVKRIDLQVARDVSCFYNYCMCL